GGDAVMVHPDIKKLSDIKGKRVSIVNIPLGLYMLNRVLDKANLSRQDVEVFPMADTHQEGFYRQGKADVVITYEPTKTRLANQGMNVIFDSSDIPNEIFDLLVVHEDTYMQRKAEICSITQQWFKTLNYMQQHPQDAANHISNRLGVEPAEFTAMLDGIVFPTRKINTQMLGGNIPGILEPAGRLNQIMLLEGQLSRDINLAHALDPDFVNCFTQ
ncbi:MAG: ABC transporter substrate-binding protein, partial [Gammaproteobacteria bacterium]|nr:ABC transporter substrate-binding protein [Gammaproteobacteria bacterium]